MSRDKQISFFKQVADIVVIAHTKKSKKEIFSIFHKQLFVTLGSVFDFLIELNKAVCMATEVACGLTGAVTNKANQASGQER